MKTIEFNEQQVEFLLEILYDINTDSKKGDKIINQIIKKLEETE